VNVFLSYASEQRTIAEEIALALRAQDHDVFFDRSSLPDGEAYDARIRDAIHECDLFVFLVSPESVTSGRYTLTELKFAGERWPSPAGKVLPVVLRPTDKDAIPAYLRAVVMLTPAGDAAAEVSAVVVRLSKPGWRRFLRGYAAPLIGLAVLGVATAGWKAYERHKSCAQAAGLVSEAELHRESADYSAGWDRYGNALDLCPGDEDARQARERLAMEWLDNIRVIVGKETFTEIVTKIQPVLAYAAVAKNDQRAADALAHLGWGDYLRSREGGSPTDPESYFGKAIDRDAENPFAHAMWAHRILGNNGPRKDAETHFAIALASGRERAYVRRMQLRAYLNGSDSVYQEALLRAVSDMRVLGEPFPLGTEHDSPRWDMWNIYYTRLVYENDRAQFLSALTPDDHLKLFPWIFPPEAVPDDKRPFYLYMLAQLQERRGEKANALATYRSTMTEITARGFESRITPKVDAAIRRLSKP
jgi:PAS domain-containing protein